MRVLVFGAEGILGAALITHLKQIGADAWGTTLSKSGSVGMVHDIDIANLKDIERALGQVRPEVAVNCAGIVKSECQYHTLERVMLVNGRAPHDMVAVAAMHGVRFVQVSTDCVFSGQRGNYGEDNPTDAKDLYGQSKAAGEIKDKPNCLTIRTSFIGRDPRRHRGLLEWLLGARAGKAVPGFVRARWSGLSAPALARAIALALTTPHIFGLYHVVGPVISKADLLEVLVREMGLGCRVERVDGEVLDRTLDGSRFAAATGYSPPEWVAMAQEFINA